MDSIKSRYATKLLVLTMLTFGLVFLAEKTRSFGLTHAQTAPPKIVNETASLVVADVAVNSDDPTSIFITFTVKNTSEKGVTAFYYDAVDHAVVEDHVEHLEQGADIVIPAGKDEQIQESISKSSLIKRSPVITIKAVIFDDHTAEGSTSAINMLEDGRHARKVGLQRMVDKIDEFLASPAAELPEAMDRLAGDIDSVSTADLKFKSRENLSGYKREHKEEIERLKAAKTKDSSVSFRDEMSKRKKDLERVIAKL